MPAKPLPAALILLLLLAVNAPLVQADSDAIKQSPIQVVDTGTAIYVWIRTPTISLLIDAAGKPNVELILIHSSGQTITIPVDRRYDLWRITLLDGTEISSTTFSLKDYKISDNTIALVYESRRFQVTVYFEASPEGVYTWLNLVNKARAPLEYVSYIILGGLAGIGGTPRDDHAVLPVQMGLEIHNPLESLPDNGYSAPYPSPLSMQFILLYDDKAGLYYGVHDPRSYYKVLKISPRTYDSNLLRIWWDFYPEKLGRVPEYTTPRILLSGFPSGDWRCGADIYRRWAHSQWYVSRGIVDERYEGTWVTGLRVWYADLLPDETDNFNPEQHAASIVELDKKLFNMSGDNLTGAVIELWNWNKGGFDNDYPEFVPSRFGDSKIQVLVELYHSLNAKVSIYFNARLVDTDTQTYRQLSSILPRDKNGKHYIEVYGGGELVAAVAHPALDAYAQILLDQIKYALEKYNVDVIFLDQVAVAAPVIDYSGNNAIGFKAGDSWYKSYIKIIDNIKNIDKEVFIAVEGVSEVYIPYVDFYWLVQTIDVRFPGNASIVHVFNYIYGDYIIVLNMEPHPESSADYYSYIAETTVSQGYIPRLTNSLLYVPEDKFTIIKRTINSLEVIRKYFINMFRTNTSLCNIISYNPKYLPVTGLARTKEAELIHRPVWKPTVDYTAFKANDDNIVLFAHKYFNVSIKFNYSVEKVLFNDTKNIIFIIHDNMISTSGQGIDYDENIYILKQRNNNTLFTAPLQEQERRISIVPGPETIALALVLAVSAALYSLQRRSRNV